MSIFEQEFFSVSINYLIQNAEEVTPSPTGDIGVSAVTIICDPVVTVYREEEAYPYLSFVADTGGILGLFIGFNFLMVWDGILWCCKQLYSRCVNLYK